MATTVGMLGLGIMGSAMSANLLDAGLDVVGHDPVTAQMDVLAAKGGAAAQSPREVAERAAIIVSVLPGVAALEAVVSGADGLIASGREGLILVECSTLPLDAKQRAHDAMAAAGMTALDCPLSGTGAQAVNRDLAVMGSGDRAAFDKCVPVFAGFARAHYHVGEFGNGSKMKFVANLLVQIHNFAAAEALVLGMKAGLDPQLVYEVIKDGAGNSRMFELRGPMMVAGDYDAATMKIDVWQKDMRIITEFAQSLGCPTPLFSASTPFYSAALSQGRDKQDTASVCAVLEQMAGVKRGRQ